jgi:hypothetical protein
MNPQTGKDLSLSHGARELLRIAVENDRRGALTKNATLLASLEIGRECVEACRAADLPALLTRFNSEPLPRVFLELTATLLTEVRRRALLLADDLGLPALTDFDRNALQALGEALADHAWPDRRAEGFDGPPLAECESRLARVDVLSFWIVTLKHYIANILLHYFSVAGIRQNARGLPADTEIKLRQVDAMLIAARVRELLAASRSRQVTATEALDALGLSVEAALAGRTNP